MTETVSQQNSKDIKDLKDNVVKLTTQVAVMAEALKNFGNTNKDWNVAIQKDVQDIKSKLDAMRDGYVIKEQYLSDSTELEKRLMYIENNYTKQESFNLVRSVVFGMVGIVLTAFILALIGLVVIRPTL